VDTRQTREVVAFAGGLLLTILLAALALMGCAPSVVNRAIALDPTVVDYTPSTGDDMAAAFQTLAASLAKGGYGVEVISQAEMIERFGDWAYGMNFRNLRHIYINGSVPVNAQFETLAHEAGHIFHAPFLNREVAEVFAELVGNRVQAYYGSKTAVQTSADYLAKFKHVFGTLPYLEGDMDRAVRVLTGKQAWPPLPPPDVPPHQHPPSHLTH
jgi:hypothetical protein